MNGADEAFNVGVRLWSANGRLHDLDAFAAEDSSKAAVSGPVQPNRHFETLQVRSHQIKRGPFRRASPLLPVRLGLLPEPEPLADFRHDAGHGATLRPGGRFANRNPQSAAAAERGRVGDRLPRRVAPAAGNPAHEVRRSLRMRNVASGGAGRACQWAAAWQAPGSWTLRTPRRPPRPWPRWPLAPLPAAA